MRTLYLPIHIGGTYHERSIANKRGLRDALAAQGDCREIDYLAISPNDLDTVLRTELDNYQPDLLFTQIQGATPITAEMLWGIRRSYPGVAVANWNGDVYPAHLTAPDMLDILQYVDVQLTVNASVLTDYERAGIHAAYCPFGYETPNATLPDVPAYDVVFLGNNYSAERARLYHALRGVDANVGFYGAGWEQSEGECNYDFAYAEALYKNARIAVSDNQFPDARGYLSDRPIQVMAAGGALLLQQTVADLAPLTGLVDGGHYIGWNSIDDLPRVVAQWLSPTRIRTVQRITQDAQAFVLSRHTWQKRVEQLVNEWLPELLGERA